MLQQLEAGEAGDDLAALREVQADLVAGKYLKAPPDAALADKAASKAKKAQRRSGGGGGGGSGAGSGGSQDFRRYESPSGFAVLLGRNSRQNDELTCRMAQPGDVWMHARWVGGRGVMQRWLGWSVGGRHMLDGHREPPASLSPVPLPTPLHSHSDLPAEACRVPTY